jgi:hypothetical protein
VLVIVLALSLTLPLVPMGDDSAQAQECVQGIRNHPLWITEVDPFQDVADEDTFLLDNGTVFTETGAELKFDVTIENRLDPGCGQETSTTDLNIYIEYMDHDGAPTTDRTDLGCENTSANDNIQPGDPACTHTISLPTNDRSVKEPDTDSGEQRIRFVVYDEAAEDDFSNCADDQPVQSGTGACAGAERVIVVGEDHLPDLVVEDVQTPEEPNTSYVGPPDSLTNVTVYIGNDGHYPNWNPNGPAGEAQYWGRSSFDGNGNGDPDEEEEGEGEEDYFYYESDVGPECVWLGEDDPPIRCSYRRGEILPTPIYHETSRSNNDTVLESGQETLYPGRGDSLNDKDDAILASETENMRNITNMTIQTLDRFLKAGEFDIDIHVDRDSEEVGDDERFNVPEIDEDNNDDEGQIDVLGVDLEISSPRVSVQTPDGGSQPCTQENPCPIENPETGEESKIEFDPRYENVGDPEVDDDTELTEREWRAAVYVNGEQIARSTESRVPATDEEPQNVFGLEETTTPDEGGGKHVAEVRLDHKDNYQEGWDTFVQGDEGVIGERTERNHCPGDDEDVDNRYCITFWFEDQNPPNIQQLRIVRPSEDGEDENWTSGDPTPQISEGSEVSFQADVEDSSLTGVTAHFQRPDGSPANLTNEDGEVFNELEMTAADDEEYTWQANVTLNGDLGEYEYEVTAEDLNHTTTEAFGTFELTQIPVDVLIGPPDADQFTVNGESSFGENAPEYEGTADDPENQLFISASINGTGHASNESVADNTSVEIVRPNGTTAAWTDVTIGERCIVESDIGESWSFDSGEGCEQARQDDNTESVDQSWAIYNVNSTEGDLDLDWVGPFDVVYHVTDTNGRNATQAQSGRIADRPNDDGEVEPTLENASVTPTAVDPGDQVEASVEAYDVLRVEDVRLNITKPSGDVVQAPLQVDEVEDQTTLNGTYAGSFDVGPEAPYFDQGGTYQVKLAAEDFAGYVTEDEQISVVVNDTQHPEIVEFRTIPNGTQEIGGPITWIAQIDDDTAIQPPVLRVDKPAGGPTGELTMEYNETRERWEYGPMEATEPEVGTWNYDLTVEDYTDKQSTAAGQIQVEENLPPQDQDWTPSLQGSDGTTYGPPNATVGVDVVDYGQGVNLSSVNFTVDGEEVTDEAEITAIDDCQGCYQVRYTPSASFDGGSTVDVTVEAADTSDPPRVSDTLRHQFTVDAEPPTADLEMAPAITTGERRVVGLPTDIDVGVSDGGSGPGTTEVTVTDGESGDSQTIKLGGGQGTFRLQEFEEVVDGHGPYEVAVTPADAVGNTAEPLERPVLFDKLGPSIEVFAEPGKPREVVFANATDDADIQKVVAKYSVDDGPEQELALEEQDGSWSVRLYNQRTDDAFQEGSTIRFTVEATDVFGNVRSSPEKNFTAGDSVPEISFVEPEAGATLEGTTELSWSADDAETPTDELRISLFYKKAGGTFEEVPDAQDVPNRGSYRLDTTTLPNGDVTLQVFVLDGQNFAADEVNVTVRNLGETFSAPELEGAQTEDGQNVVAPGQETTFRVQIDGNVQSARAEIRQDGTTVQTVQLESAAGSTWQGTFAAPNERGNYTVDLFAETSEGTEEAGSAYAFSVQGEPEGDNFIPEWTLLTALTATAVALGALGLRSRWT